MGSADLLLGRLRAGRRALLDEMRAVSLHTAAGRDRCIALMKELRTLDDFIITQGEWRGWDRGYRLVLVPDSFRGG